MARPSRLKIGHTTIDTLAYNDSAIGDLLEVRPGDTLRLTLDNQLDEATNLHFHGLHIPPNGTGDDVFRHVKPGESYTYEFQLAPDHPATLAYYHPHKHGSVARQIFGGLGGAIVVRGAIDDLPALQAVPEEIVILKGFDRDFRRTPRGREHLKGRHGEFLTINGQQEPHWKLPENGLLRLRLLNASTAREYRLRLDDRPLHLIGTDGGAIEQPVALEELKLAPGERADLLVRGDRPPGRCRLLDVATSEAVTLATLDYGDKDDAVSPETPIALPETLTMIEPLPEPTTTHRITLGHGMGPNGMVFLLDGQPFDPDRVDVRARLGDIEDWEISNRGMTAHPFHIHTNAFQVVSRNDRPEPFRAWKDTVRIEPGEVVRLRTRYENSPGKTVFHCHILDHEDAGMMGILAIEA